MKRLLIVVASGLLALGGGARAQEQKPAYPAEFEKYVDTIERLEHYEQLIHRHGWKETFSQEMTNAAVVKLKLQEPDLHPSIRNQFMRVTTVDSAPALSVRADQFERFLVEMGPKVAGDYAIEMVVRSDGPFPNDLSIFTNEFEGGPGLQFGGYANTRNVLWYGKDGEGDKAAEACIDGSDAVLITPGKWHCVRMEVRDGQVVGMVDGRTIARHALGNKVDRSAPRQPIFYIFRSNALLKEFRVETPDPAIKPMEPERAWKESFVRTPRETVDKQITELADRLGDPDPVAREAATDLLLRSGETAHPALKQVLQSSSLEARERARILLGTEAQPTPPRAAQPAN